MSGKRADYSPPQSPEFVTEHIAVKASETRKANFTLAQIPNHLKKQGKTAKLDLPFRREQLIAVLELAAVKHEDNRPSFVLFPEASIPLILLEELAELLKEQSFPSNFVVLLGLEYMSLAEFADMLHESDNSSEEERLWIKYVQSRYRTRRGPKAVNCGVVLCKTDGDVKRFVQAKLKGGNVQLLGEGDLLEGKFIHLFLGKDLSFVPLICQDLTYRESSYSIVGWLRREALRLYLEEEKTLDFVFVLQCNPYPDDLSCRRAIDSYYDIRLSGGPFRDTCFVLPNASHLLVEGKRVEGDFGHSAVSLPPKCSNLEPHCSEVRRNDSSEQDRLMLVSTEPCVLHFGCHLLREFHPALPEESDLGELPYSPILNLETFNLKEYGVEPSGTESPVSLSHVARSPLKTLDAHSLRVQLAIDARLGERDIVVPSPWKSQVKKAVAGILSSPGGNGVVVVTGQPGSGKTVFLYLVCTELMAKGHVVSWLSGALTQDVKDIVLFDDIDKLTPGVFGSLLSHRPSRALFSCRTHELEYIKKLLGKKLFRYTEITVELSGIENSQFIREIAKSMAGILKINILPGALSVLSRRKGVIPLFVTTLLDEIRTRGERKLTTGMASKLPVAYMNVIHRALDSTLRAVSTQQGRKVRVVTLAALAAYGKPMSPLHIRALEALIAKRIRAKTATFRKLDVEHLPVPLRRLEVDGKIWFTHDTWAEVLRNPDVIPTKSTTGRILSVFLEQINFGELLHVSLKKAVERSTRAAKAGAKEAEELTSLIRDAVERKWFEILPSDFAGTLVEYERGNLTQDTIELFKECSLTCMEASQPGDKSEKNLGLSAEALSEAAKHYRQQKNWTGYAGIRSSLGLIYSRLAEIGVESERNLGLAAEAFSEAAELYREQENRSDYPEVLGNLGLTYFRLAEIGVQSESNLKLAAKALSEAAELYKQQEKWGHHAKASQNLGLTYVTLAEVGLEPEENLKSSVEALSRAAKLFKEQENWANYVGAAGSMADAYRRLAEIGVEPEKNEALAEQAFREVENAKARGLALR